MIPRLLIATVKKAAAKPAPKRPKKKDQDEANNPPEEEKKPSPKGDKGDKGEKPKKKNKNWEWADPRPNSISKLFYNHLFCSYRYEKLEKTCGALTPNIFPAQDLRDSCSCAAKASANRSCWWPVAMIADSHLGPLINSSKLKWCQKSLMGFTQFCFFTGHNFVVVNSQGFSILC